MQNTLYIPIDTTIDNPVECEKLVKRGDTVVLNIKVFNNGSLANLTGQSIDLILRKLDGTLIQKEIDTNNISNGTVTAKLDIQATVVAGLVSGELQLSDSNGQNSTNTFTFNVSSSVADNVIEVSKNDINVLNELRQLIANGEAVIAQYKDHILAIANSIEAIEALENIKSYIDTNLAALENNNAQAVVNTNNLKVENDKAPGLTISLKAQNDAATSNISTLTTKNQEAVANKNNIDSSISVANTSKIALDTSNTNATNTKNALDTLNTTATNTKNALNTVNQTGQVLLNSLEEFEQEHADVTDISNQLANVNTQLSENTQYLNTISNAKFDGVTDDTSAINQAIQNGNCLFPYNKTCLINGTITIPSNRIIDLNNCTLQLGDSGKIAIGSIPAIQYVKFIKILNGTILSSNTSNISRNLVECKQSIFIEFINIKTPDVPASTTVFDILNCFNVIFNNCPMGYNGGGIANLGTKGINIYETAANIIAGTNNNTNLSIKNCLIQCIENGIILAGENGIIDTAELENVGFSYNTNALTLSGGIENTNINVKCMRAEYCTNGIINNNTLSIDGLHIFNCNTGIINTGRIYISNYAVRGNNIQCVLNNTGYAYALTTITSSESNTIIPGNFSRKYIANYYDVAPSNMSSYITKFNNTNLIMNQNFDLSVLPTSSEFYGVRIYIHCNTGLTITGGAYGNSYKFGDYQIAELVYKNNHWFVLGGANIKV